MVVVVVVPREAGRQTLLASRFEHAFQRPMKTLPFSVPNVTSATDQYGMASATMKKMMVNTTKSLCKVSQQLIFPCELHQTKKEKVSV